MRLPLARPKKTAQPRPRRYSVLLFSAGLIGIFFLVRAIPADWEIGPFRIGTGGDAANPAAGLYFADDPHSPFWALVPTFNLPPRFFAARPTGPRPVALGPPPSAAPSDSPAPTTSATPSSSASPSPSGTPTPTAGPTATPAPTPR